MSQPLQGRARVRVEADTSQVVPQVLAAVQAAVSAAQQALAEGLVLTADPTPLLDAVAEATAAVAGVADEAATVVLDADASPLLTAVGEAEAAVEDVADDSAEITLLANARPLLTAVAEAQAAVSAVGGAGVDTVILDGNPQPLLDAVFAAQLAVSNLAASADTVVIDGDPAPLFEAIAQASAAVSGLSQDADAVALGADPRTLLDAVAQSQAALEALARLGPNVSIGADASQVVTETGRAEGALSGLRAAAAAVGPALSVAFAAAAGSAVALGTATITAGIGFNSLSQQVTGALTAVLQSRDAANQLITSVIELNQTAAFSRQAFLDATRQLVGFGVAADLVVPALDAIQQATVAIGGGEDEFARITEAIARVQAEGGLTAGTLGILGRLGLDVITIIADATGQAVSAVREQMDAGMIGLEEITSALNTRFAGAVEGYGNTWEGAIGLVLAGLRNIGSALVEPFIGLESGGVAVGLLNDLADVLFSVQQQALPLAEALGTRLEPAVSGLSGGLQGLTSAIERTDFQQLFDTVARGASVFAGLGAAVATAGSASALSAVGLGRLAGALNPVAAAIAAVALTSPELRGALVDLADAAAPLIPVAVDLAASLGPALSATLAALAAALTPIVSLLDVVVSAFDALPGPVQTATLALTAAVLLGPRLNKFATSAATSVTAFGTSMVRLPAQVTGAVASLRAASVSLASVGRAARGALTALGGPLGIAIVGLTLLGSGSAQTSANIEDLTEDLERLAERQRVTGELLQLIGDDTANFGQTIADAAEEFERIEGSFRPPDFLLFGELQDQRDALESIEAIDQALSQMVRSGTDVDVVFGALQEQYGLTDEQLEQLLLIMPETSTAIGRQADATRDAAEDQQGLAGSVEEATAALRAQADELLAQVDPMFALHQSLQAVEQAQGDFNTAVADHGPNSAEAREAAFALTEETLRLQGAVGDAAGTFTGRLDPALRDTLSALGLTDEQLAIIEDAFGATADAGDRFAKDYVAQLELRGEEEAQQRIERIQRIIDNIDRTVRISFEVEGFRPVPGVAIPNRLGGIYDRPVLSTLAEDWRPEVVLPLTRPERMTQLIAAPVVQQPVVRALAQTLRRGSRRSRNDALTSLLAELGAPAPEGLLAALSGPQAGAAAAASHDPGLVAELQALRRELHDDVQAFRAEMRTARPISVTQAPGEDGEALAKRVVGRMALAGVT